MGEGDIGSAGDSPVGGMGVTSSDSIGDMGSDSSIATMPSLEGVTITGSGPAPIGSPGDSPVGNLGVTVTNKPNIFQQLMQNKPFQMLVSLISKGHPAAQAANMIAQFAANPQGGFGAAMGSALGGGLGSVGSAIGGMAGGAAGNSAAGIGDTSAPSTNSDASTGGGMNPMEMLPYLGSLYLQGKTAGQYNDLAGGLQSLYTQDSPYAQMLRQQLVRKDAASGRRSQYGGREVELQARLAELNSRNAPTLANLRASASIQRANQLKDLYGLMQSKQGQQFMKNVPEWYNQAKDYAVNQYNQYTAPDYSMDMGTPITGGSTSYSPTYDYADASMFG